MAMLTEVHSKIEEFVVQYFNDTKPSSSSVAFNQWKPSYVLFQMSCLIELRSAT